MIFVQYRFHLVLVVPLLIFIHHHELALRVSLRLFSVLLPEFVLDLENVLAIFVTRGLTSSEAEVAKSDTTVTVHEQIAGFQIPVQQVSGVDVIEGAQGVIEHRDDVVLFEDGAPVHGVQDLFEVGLDVLDDHKNLLEVFGVDVLVVIQLLMNDLLTGHR